MNIMAIILSTALVNNFVLVRFLGICPFLGVSKKVDEALGMGIAVVFVMTLASVACWAVDRYILAPLNLAVLQTLAFIIIIASLVQFVEMVIKKSAPGLYAALGVYLPLITTNCAVLGVAILNLREGYNLIQTLASALGAGAGFTLAIALFASVRERTESAPVPPFLRGFPLTLVTAGLLALAFLGFRGII